MKKVQEFVLVENFVCASYFLKKFSLFYYFCQLASFKVSEHYDPCMNFLFYSYMQFAFGYYMSCFCWLVKPCVGRPCRWSCQDELRLQLPLVCWGSSTHCIHWHNKYFDHLELFYECLLYARHCSRALRNISEWNIERSSFMELIF